MNSSDWDLLRVVLQISRDGALTRAAAELGLSHSTLSRRIQAAEEFYGGELFERHGRGVRPTELGARVIDAALRMEHSALQLERELLGEDVNLRGELRVTMPNLIALRHASTLAEFSRRYPGLRLELACSDETADLGRREADVALRLANDPPPHLVGRKILRAEFALYGHPDLVGTCAADLAELPWLAWDPRKGARITEAWMRRHVPHANVVATVNDATAMLALLRAGVGVAFYNCADGDACAELERLRPPEPEFGMDLWALTHADIQRSARVRCFMDHIFEALRPWRERYAGEPAR